MPIPAPRTAPLLRLVDAPTADTLAAAEDRSAQAVKEGIMNDLCVHLVSVSAGMVGVCLTVIGLLQLTNNLQKVATLADDLVAIDAMLFLSVCILSYCALRTVDRERRQRWERIADVLFLAAMCFMAVICGVIVWAIA